MMNVICVLAEIVQRDLHWISQDLPAIHISGGHIRPWILHIAGPADGNGTIAMALNTDTTIRVIDGTEEVVWMQAIVVDAHRLHKVILLVGTRTIGLPIGATTGIDNPSRNYLKKKIIERFLFKFL